MIQSLRIRRAREERAGSRAVRNWFAVSVGIGVGLLPAATALAGAMDFERGETVEWSIQDRSTLVLTRPSAERIPLKKKQKEPSSGSSKSSSGRQRDSLDRKGSLKRQGR